MLSKNLILFVLEEMGIVSSVEEVAEEVNSNENNHDCISNTENSEATSELSSNGVDGSIIPDNFTGSFQEGEDIHQNIEIAQDIEPSTDGVVQNVNATNYRTFINTLKTLNKADGATFENVKQHMDENNIQINNKQLRYYLYRGVRNRELKKFGAAGQKKFTIIKKHNSGI